jgi:hypothetical protein
MISDAEASDGIELAWFITRTGRGGKTASKEGISGRKYTCNY